MKNSVLICQALAGIGEGTRLKIVDLLRGGPCNVTDIAENVGVEIVNCSHHMKVLTQNNVAVSEKAGREVFYSINPEILADKNTLKIDSITIKFNNDIPERAKSKTKPVKAKAEPKAAKPAKAKPENAGKGKPKKKPAKAKPEPETNTEEKTETPEGFTTVL